MNYNLKNDINRLLNSLNDLVEHKNNRNVKELMKNVDSSFYYLTKYDLDKLSQDELENLNDACLKIKLVKFGAWIILMASLGIDILGLLITLLIAGGKDYLAICAFLYFGYQIYIDTIGDSMYSVPVRGLRKLAVSADKIIEEISLLGNEKELKESEEQKKESLEENGDTLKKEDNFGIFDEFLNNIKSLNDEDKMDSFIYLMNEVNSYIAINPNLKYFFRGKVAECYYEVLNSINNVDVYKLISVVNPCFIDDLVEYGNVILDGFGQSLEIIRFRNYLYRNRNKFSNLDNFKFISEFLVKNKSKELRLERKINNNFREV